MGKLMQKAGSALNNQKLEQKGLEKRQAEGFDGSATGTSGTSDNY